MHGVSIIHNTIHIYRVSAIFYALYGFGFCKAKARLFVSLLEKLSARHVCSTYIYYIGQF